MKKGFTIIELIVCVAIISLVSAIVFWNGRGFNDSLELGTASQDASLAVREAQSYAVGVKETTIGTGQFSFAYGAVFDKRYPSYIFIFADKNANGVYDGGSTCSGSDECVEKITLRNGVTITNLCATDSFGSASCSSSWSSLQFIFRRPNPDALIVITNSFGSVISNSSQSATVTLASQLGTIKKIAVNSTGQIGIQ